MKAFLNASEVARLLNVDRATVSRWVKKGVIKGKKVLLVDLDQQASATRYLDPDQSPNLYDVFLGTKPAQLAIRKTKFQIDVLASHVLLAAIEEALEPGDEFKLLEFLNPLKPSYDYILIDTPPGKAMLAFNGLAAADLIIIPASAERMAVDGVADLINHVQKIMWNKYALTHQELRILFTMYRSTATHSPATVANARKIWRENILTVKIPHSTIFSKSYDQKTPLAMLDANIQARCCAAWCEKGFAGVQTVCGC